MHKFEAATYKRNREILRLWLSGATMTGLARAYHITAPRVRQIIVRLWGAGLMRPSLK
jgi:hypothetical protein